jgi:AAA family ATP:ADP antiporter
MGLVPFYGWLGTRVGRIRLITLVTTFFAGTWWRSMRAECGVSRRVAFYIWIGLLNVFIVSQFWQFTNDLFTESQGRGCFR